MVCLELKMVWKLKWTHRWLHVENILVARRAWNASKQIFNKLWKIRVWYFSALYPLTFKTTISLLFPIQKKQPAAAERAIATVALELLNKAISWNTQLRKFAFWIQTEPLSTWLHAAKTCPHHSQQTSPPVSAEPWQQKASQFVETEGNSQKEKKWRNSYFIGICCPYPRKPSS